MDARRITACSICQEGREGTYMVVIKDVIIFVSGRIRIASFCELVDPIISSEASFLCVDSRRG